MVGYNRRFAPMACSSRNFCRTVHGPLSMHYRVNAGHLPADHWVNDPEQGGGRIIGEVCHFVDFSDVSRGRASSRSAARTLDGSAGYSNDNIVASLKFANGSHGTISYLANGDRSFSKERLEVFGGAAVAVLEDFRRLELVRNGREQISRARWRRIKGIAEMARRSSMRCRANAPPPIPFEEIVCVNTGDPAATAIACRGRDSEYQCNPIRCLGIARRKRVNGWNCCKCISLSDVEIIKEKGIRVVHADLGPEHVSRGRLGRDRVRMAKLYSPLRKSD